MHMMVEDDDDHQTREHPPQGGQVPHVDNGDDGAVPTMMTQTSTLARLPETGVSPASSSTRSSPRPSRLRTFFSGKSSFFDGVSDRGNKSTAIFRKSARVWRATANGLSTFADAFRLREFGTPPTGKGGRPNMRNINMLSDEAFSPIMKKVGLVDIIQLAGKSDALRLLSCRVEAHCYVISHPAGGTASLIESTVVCRVNVEAALLILDTNKQSGIPLDIKSTKKLGTTESDGAYLSEVMPPYDLAKLFRKPFVIVHASNSKIPICLAFNSVAERDAVLDVLYAIQVLKDLEAKQEVSS